MLWLQNVFEAPTKYQTARKPNHFSLNLHSVRYVFWTLSHMPSFSREDQYNLAESQQGTSATQTPIKVP